MGLFADTTGDFWKAKYALKEEYQPNDILEREKEIESYKYSLKGSFTRVTSRTISFCTGKQV